MWHDRRPDLSPSSGLCSASLDAVRRARGRPERPAPDKAGLLVRWPPRTARAARPGDGASSGNVRTAAAAPRQTNRPDSGTR
ncbi:hypothetical protein CDD83_10983 [Cordyceps sp. RAO-2017]|nr:hypothetical protein CDD83_10983 [Cordyceps sp. RAO-2017]